MVVLIDLRFGSGHDICKRQLRSTIRGWILADWVLYAGFAVPCSSWTRARNRPGGPQRLRSREHIYGEPVLRAEGERWKIDLGNTAAAFAVAAARLLHSKGRGFFIENPRTSWMWEAPPVARLTRTPGCRLVRADFCQFGAPFRKPTNVLTNGAPEPLAKMCANSPRGFCSRTGRRHMLLRGTDAEGRFLTSLAEAYPRQFAAALVRSLETHRHETDSAAFWAIASA